MKWLQSRGRATQVLLRVVCSGVGAVWHCQISALNQRKIKPIFNRLHLSLRAHSVSLCMWLMGGVVKIVKQKGERNVATRPLWATLRHRSSPSDRLPNFMIQLRFTWQSAFCSVSVFCSFRKLVSLDSIEKKPVCCRESLTIWFYINCSNLWILLWNAILWK